jgi:CDP-diacylglycerol--serine O-phosphatidyltransferase
MRTPGVARAVKRIAILPTLLTLGNAVCGFAALVFASKIDPGDPATNIFFVYSAWLILGAMVFDGLDGYVARLSKTASEFGGQLDSLCDAISFGVAPAFLLLRLGQAWRDVPVARQALAVIAVLYMACAILRLARFNVENTPDPASHKRFKGLPSPGAAGCVASLAILSGDLSSWMDADRVHAWVMMWAPLGGLVVALLMVSRVPYPHVTKQLLRGRRHFSHLVEVLLLVGLMVVTYELALFLVFWGYALSMPVRTMVYRSLRNRSLAASKPGLEDLPR